MSNVTKNTSQIGKSRHTYSVALVEPQPYLRDKFAEVLRRHEAIAAVLQASSLEELMREIGRFAPDFVLADIAMLNLPESVGAIRRSAPWARIIGLSTSRTEPYVKTSSRLGLDGLIEKGHVTEEFLEQIETLCP